MHWAYFQQSLEYFPCIIETFILSLLNTIIFPLLSEVRERGGGGGGGGGGVGGENPLM